MTMGSKNFTIVSKDPRIQIKKRKRYTVIDLNCWPSLYELNEEGARVIIEYIKKIEPYIDHQSKRYLTYINCRYMYIRILNEYADQFIKFLTEVTNDKKKYMTRICESDDFSDFEREMIREYYERSKERNKNVTVSKVETRNSYVSEITMNRHIPEAVGIGVIIEENKGKRKFEVVNEIETRKKGGKRKLKLEKEN